MVGPQGRQIHSQVQIYINGVDPERRSHQLQGIVQQGIEPNCCALGHMLACQHEKLAHQPLTRPPG